jgi:hypothetical protein
VPDESQEARHSRELIELRVALPGVQVLFAVLLVVTATVFMLPDFVFHRACAATFTAIVAVLFLVFWSTWRPLFRIAGDRHALDDDVVVRLVA